MDNRLNETLTDIAKFLKNEATTKTVVGEAFKLGNFECVPVIRVGMGFGSGTGERDLPRKEHDEGIGAGVGMGIDPIGFLVTNMETIEFIPTKSSPGISTMFEKAPELIEKYFEGRMKETQATHN